MESHEAILIAALDACAHFLLANIAILEQVSVESKEIYILFPYQLPTTFWDLFNILYGFHECVVTQRNLGNPNRTQEVGPSKCCCLFKRAFGVWTENAHLNTY